MKLICGLGNPGKAYEAHRHNIGFRVLEAFANAIGFTWLGPKFEAMWSMGNFQGQRILLLKPQTYMNLSGHSLCQAIQFYKVDTSQLLVVHDELDLPFGRLQFKQGGGHGGHNGLRSISEQLGHNNYARLRFGIDKPRSDIEKPPADDTKERARERIVSHVLSGISVEERSAEKTAILQATQALGYWAEEGVAAAMNRYNQRKEAKKA
ncbi:MAG: aminoacyl-tRNA hydrolase [Proteobacteria bacterium]|nr:aminoacyl-tRNA hydrolase [Cystobacterineae bacterium]MCL2314589.1 aminoacyl-tRNA hydrolase [Pseudomonadota bacterium]